MSALLTTVGGVLFAVGLGKWFGRLASVAWGICLILSTFKGESWTCGVIPVAWMLLPLGV